MLGTWQYCCIECYRVNDQTFGVFQLTEADQELYKNFPLVVSERWQQEVAETVFETINADYDKLEQKRARKPKSEDMEISKC